MQEQETDILNMLLRINEESSTFFLSAEPKRKRYLAQHPTHVVWFRCMDGRIHPTTITDTPTGIDMSFCALGGKFEAFWPTLMTRLRKYVRDAMQHGVRSVFFITYHFSNSHNEHLGCAGWEYDTASARAHNEEFAAELRRAFGEQATVIVVGIETDFDILTLHGSNRDISGRDLIPYETSDKIMPYLRASLSDTDEQTLKDILPFMEGNRRHVQQLIEHPRETEKRGHCERVIAVGQGYDWLTRSNMALIVNDVDPNLDEAIVTAAEILHNNVISAPNGNVALCANVSYYEPGMDRNQAAVRSRGLLQFARKHIAKHRPELLNTYNFRYFAGVTFEPSKKFELIETPNV